MISVAGCRRSTLDARADADTIAALRELVDRVVIIDAPNNAVEVQVIGRLAILGNDAEIFGGRW